MASRDKKKLKNHEKEEPKDRLSDLPDSLLLHILSFLPETRLSVQTSVLSKRWKSLWASLPDLIFHLGWKSESFSTMKFANEVLDKVLSGRNNLPLRKLCLKYPGSESGLDESSVTKLINYATSHNVQHFSIRIRNGIEARLRPGDPTLRIFFPLFNGCCSLKTLEIDFFIHIHLLCDISLPTLTTLHISSSHFEVRELTDSVDLDPFVGLFNLKSLKLIDFKVDFGYGDLTKSRPFKISGPQLHSLTLCWYSSNLTEIFAPKLHSFKFINPNAVEFSNIDFPLLETAIVDADPCLYHTRYDEISHFHLISMFRGLYNAQSLYLSSGTIESLMHYPTVIEDQASPFGRLKTLNVKSHCKRVDIPNTIMNYFGRGTTFGLNLSIEIEEKQWWEN